MGTSRLVIIVCLLAGAVVGAGAGLVFSNDPTRGYGSVIAVANVIAALVLIAASSRDTPRPQPSIPEPQPEREPEPEQPDSWQQQLLAFAIELKGSGAREAVHRKLVDKLPQMLGVDRIWLTASFDGRRQTFAKNHDDSPISNPLLSGEATWTTFPLKVGSAVAGVLALDVTRGPLRPHVRKSMPVIANLLAETLHTVDTIEELRRRSNVDQLTGVGTRQSGLQRLRAELSRAQRAHRELAVLMLDLDNFKQINDRFGHPVGDAVLSAIGRTLQQTLRASDISCRWGGDEFLVVLPETGVDQALRVAGTIASRIGSTATHYHDSTIRVTPSIGITIAGPGDDDPDVLISRADQALYTARKNGRNRIHVSLKSNSTHAAS